MAGTANPKRKKRKTRTKSRNRKSLQKPNGVISPRVAKVGGECFAIVCIDPAKYRSEWMMADYFGNVLIPAQTLEHQAAFFKIAFARKSSTLGKAEGSTSSEASASNATDAIETPSGKSNVK